MTTASMGIARPRPRISWIRRAAVRALQATSRWIDQRAHAIEYPEQRIHVQVGGAQVEVARDPHTGFAVVYLNGERQFTFVRGLDRL